MAPRHGPVRIALFGFGRVCRRMAALLARRDGVEIVAVISRSLAGEPARTHAPELPAGIAIAADARRAFADADGLAADSPATLKSKPGGARYA